MNYDLLKLFLNNKQRLSWKRNKGAPCISAIYKDYNISLCLYKDENSQEFIVVNINKIFNGVKKDVFKKRIYSNENTFHDLKEMYFQGYQNSKIIGAFAVVAESISKGIADLTQIQPFGHNKRNIFHFLK